MKLSFLEDGVILEIEENGEGFLVPASLTDFSQNGHFGLMASRSGFGRWAEIPPSSPAPVKGPAFVFNRPSICSLLLRDNYGLHCVNSH